MYSIRPRQDNHDTDLAFSLSFYHIRVTANRVGTGTAVAATQNTILLKAPEASER